MPRTSYVAVGAAAVFAAFLVLILGDWSFGPHLSLIDDLVFVAMSVPPVAFSLLTARAVEGRTRLAWLSLAVGLLGWGIGEALWAYYEIRLHEVPFPSIADAAYLVFPVGACVALLLFPVGHTTQSRWRLFLDGMIVAGSLFLVSWVTILAPLYHSDQSDRLAFIVSLAYPISDLVIFTVAGVVLVRVSGPYRLSLTLLTLGLACFALSDSAFVYLAAKGEYASGNVIDIGWAAGLLLIAVAAAAGRQGAYEHGSAVALPGWASVWLPFAPLILAGLVLAAKPAPLLESRVVLVVTALLVVIVIARQFVSVGESRRLVATVVDQALHDSLTGLANRALFNERLAQAMRMHEHEGLPLAVVAADLNDFKLVNDNLGHLVGDDLLIGVAHRLLNCVRAGDTVARVGGDEFAVLVDGGAETAEGVGHRVVEAFEEPFLLSGHELLIRPSIGLAAAEPDEPDLSVEQLLKRADIAMYTAKRSRASAVQTYSPEMQLLADADDKRLFGAPPPQPGLGAAAAIQLLGKLRVAIEHGELTLVYQPKFDLRTGEIVGAEALLRWPQPDGSVLAPDQFLPLVRRHGLMGSVTQLVIGKALDDARSWHRAGADVSVAVNLFAPSVANVDLPETIAHALADHGLRPSALTVEITEELFMDSTERTRTVLEELRHNGIRIAIDDFGSGYSALSYLRDLPIDEVKLDRTFIASILIDQRAAAVVRAVVDLAHVLGLTVVVEGVEDEQTAALVRELGCDIGQGFFYALPLPPDELLERVKTAVSGSLQGRRC
ncbi:bifunctional diguanylate cyclase/phosphodiesterase [Mycobacterium crocinum]|uniref:Bifunctional diguanylate cyclase/phosphodiesterase n=1 Tax=Mycolicibacterium crocinum TaxID=388459 RepID=A0ABY3TUP5_9MYCO|nr:bifunctional diguanylate cyclase/phosphodiesterase [Mycolicibacterium crocinum]MCV7218777.1 bifunctional diguanylate cyclase/phosphodiesterase [Mycolicibacterium crocinum]ULN43823.1 bifunctional diguanylate cyclase/phosphodiesterase [Mycolicibacterium crocinum]